MKRLPGNIILLGMIDVICIGLFFGSTTGILVKEIRRRRHLALHSEDPIILELKQKSPKLKKYYSKVNKKLTSVTRLPSSLLVGGGKLILNNGKELLGFELHFKNHALARFLKLLIEARKNQKFLYTLKGLMIFLNAIAFKLLGMKFVTDGSVGYVQMFVLFTTLSISGFLISTLSSYSSTTLLWLSSLFTLGYRFEDVAQAYDQCLLICEAMQEQYEREIKLQM